MLIKVEYVRCHTDKRFTRRCIFFLV